MSRVLITGASGFIGSHLCEELAAAGVRMRVAVRKPLTPSALAGLIEQSPIDGIGPSTDWSTALSDVETVVHLAACTQLRGYGAQETLAGFRATNVEGTRRLAEASVRAGVRRFLFVSSIKAVGEETEEPEGYAETSPCGPADPYGISKHEAEQVLLNVAGTDMEAVILRAPLVYGPRAGANFLRLLRAIDRGMPLPLRSARNRRSLLFVLNLTDAMVLCAQHPEASGQIFHVADAEALSTRELAVTLGRLLGRPARLLPLPVAGLRFAGALLGRSDDISRLTTSLTVSSEKIRNRLGWAPPFTLEQGLRKTVEWYRSRPQPNQWCRPAFS